MNKPAAAAAALALAACAHTPPPVDHTASLAAAEAAFAAHSVREDMRVAFLGAFADDGVFVREGWRVSNDFLRDRPAPPIVLDWRPQYVEASASGDLGLSTGPSKITSKTDASAAPSYGQFVSVWRREPGGAWKVAVDLGIAHAGDALWSAPLETRQLRESVGARDAGGVLEAEARFAADARSRGLRAAYEAHGADNMRFYRPGEVPRVTRAAALASPAMAGDAPAWTVERSETARAGDLAYARGAYAARGAPTVALGWYLRVWRREAGQWRVVMDVVNPAPPRKPA
jgi:ketosteroid isomerase-like protein